MSRSRLPLYWIVAGIALAAYAVLNHYVMAVHAGSSLAAWLPLAPVAVAAGAVAWRSRWRYLLLGAGAGLLVLLWLSPERMAPGDKVLYAYLAEHVGINALLGWGFGSTLLAGREPLCTRLARSVHGVLPPEVERYSRAVTAAWTVFFGSVAAVSLLLFFFASIDAWSIFANFVNLPLAIAMFVAEYRIRLRALPDFQHASIMTSFRSFSASSKPAGAVAESGQG
ncbi:COG4648 family protein [Methylococcus geothermalis]|uniref:Transmembrane protein n=1 Tax=Methylococcus geothermalis TaxID=2681310 RepID=A0A858QAD1_9GAMM|nr:hypothetical protein [Methylococcus geothermalis]QJD30839.1 hypothetical protein GNH96_13265 [Methylococcus geothermalis]